MKVETKVTLIAIVFTLLFTSLSIVVLKETLDNGMKVMMPVMRDIHG